MSPLILLIGVKRIFYRIKQFVEEGQRRHQLFMTNQVRFVPSLDSKKLVFFFFSYVNACDISFNLHFTTILFYLLGLRLFPFNLVCMYYFS